MIYSDTSALISMLIERKHSRAINKSLVETRKKVLIWKLCEVELHCAMKSMVTNKGVQFTQTSMNQALQELHYKEDLHQVVRKPIVNLDEIFDLAIQLTEKQGFNGRSLDTIHVASAKVFNCSHFLSADEEQRKLAKRAGLELLPKVLNG